MAPPAGEKPFRCSYCAKTFGRLGHRKRHELTHANNTDHHCAVCGKGFARRDALRRHELTHQNAGPSLLNQGHRACMGCAAARARCSGVQPCTRCLQRGKACTFPGNNVLPVEVEAQNSTIHNPMEPETGNSGSHDDTAAFHGAGLDVLSTNRPELLQNYQPDFWDPNILASTNWLDNSNLNGFDLQDYDFPLQPWAAPDVPVVSPFATCSTDQESPAQPHSDVTSQSSYRPKIRTGEFYVDGENARQPKAKKRRATASQLTKVIDLTAAFCLREPEIHSPTDTADCSIDQGEYDSLSKAYDRLCCTPSPIWATFQQATFPSRKCFETLVSLCSKHCSRMIPILPARTFSQQQLHHTLILALASIGAHCIDCDNKIGFVTSLHEFQRRLMRSVEGDACISGEAGPVHRDAVILLYMVGAAYSGRPQLVKDAINTQYVLRDILNRNSISVQTGTQLDNGQVKDNATWQIWQTRESRVRLAYFAWQLDCMLTYHHATKPMLSLSDADIQLPCHEKLWEAVSWEQWLAAAFEQPGILIQPPTLPRAMQEIYIDKHLPQDRGDFARVLMIHALFHRSWDVERYFADPLSQWEPVAARQQSLSILKDPVWLPANQVFAKWQNSTCDVLDILHLQANITIAQANLHEHPPILHLHVARIVLLAPCKAIVSLARLLTESDQHGRLDKIASIAVETNTIRQWAIGHQFKARLSLIHAGALYWHARRYSVGAFYEAPAVALAALTLWAFGSFANVKSHSRETTTMEPSLPATGTSAGEMQMQDDGDSEEICDIVMLDRPIDDELCQVFIKSGSSMEARLGGVGNLYEAEGPERVLNQGLKILAQYENTWGVARDWRVLIERLSAYWKAQRIAKGGTA